jgi:hypothetical protein
MIFKKDISRKQLDELFTSNEKCLEFLSELKWKDGFVCRKCGNTNFCPGKTPYSRRCTKCKTDESATSGTIFHHCRFDINKAFFIAYNVCKGNEDFSTYEFARKLSLRQMTCWKFKDKLKKAIEEAGERSDNWIEILK